MDVNIQTRNNTINGECSNCGECCSTFLPMTSKEVETIEDYLKEHPKILNQRHIDFKKGDMHITCTFRDDVNKKCNIYEVRPSICRKFICNQVPQVIKVQKKKALRRAVVNSAHTPSISTQLLFFDDLEWDMLFFKNQTKTIDDAIKLAQNLKSPIVNSLKMVRSEIKKQKDQEAIAKANADIEVIKEDIPPYVKDTVENK